MIRSLVTLASALLAYPAIAGTILSGPSSLFGPAGGALTGTYPAPGIANGAVGNSALTGQSNALKGNAYYPSQSIQDLSVPNCVGALQALQFTAGSALTPTTPGAFSCGPLGSNPQFQPTQMFTAASGISLTGGGPLQSNCANLTKVINNVTYTPTGGYSVCLPAAVAGEMVIVNNQSNKYIVAFASATTSDTINGGATTASVNVSASTLAVFTAAANGKWQVSVYVIGTPGDILTYDSTGNPQDGGLLTGDCTSVSLVISCTNFSHVLTLAKPVVLPAYTVGTLPTTAGNGKVQGARAFVTDALSCTYLTNVASGGSTFCPVIYSGAHWVAD